MIQLGLIAPIVDRRAERNEGFCKPIPNDFTYEATLRCHIDKVGRVMNRLDEIDGVKAIYSRVFGESADITIVAENKEKLMLMRLAM